MTKILVALDDSDASKHAGEVAKRLFEHAEILAINVASVAIPWADSIAWGAVGPFPYPTPIYTTEQVEEQQRLVAEMASDTAETVAHEAGIADVEPLSATGDVAESIMQAAHEHGVDLIVVGWSDKGWFGRLLEGSVARDIVRTSDVPVLVAK